MADEWLSVTECEDTKPWSISVDGFFRANVEKQMLADDMTPEEISCKLKVKMVPVENDGYELLSALLEE